MQRQTPQPKAVCLYYMPSTFEKVELKEAELHQGHLLQRFGEGTDDTKQTEAPNQHTKQGLIGEAAECTARKVGRACGFRV